jgi:hypothetical protein
MRSEENHRKLRSREAFMRRAYLEPDQVSALVDIFQEAKRLLERHGTVQPYQLDAVAHRILQLASEGMPPWLILAEIMPPLSAQEAGLPLTGREITLASQIHPPG